MEKQEKECGKKGITREKKKVKYNHERIIQIVKSLIDARSWSFTLKGFCGMSAYRLCAPRGNKFDETFLG